MVKGANYAKYDLLCVGTDNARSMRCHARFPDLPTRLSFAREKEKGSEKIWVRFLDRDQNGRRGKAAPGNYENVRGLKRRLLGVS